MSNDYETTNYNAFQFRYDVKNIARLVYEAKGMASCISIFLPRITTSGLKTSDLTIIAPNSLNTINSKASLTKFLRYLG